MSDALVIKLVTKSEAQEACAKCNQCCANITGTPGLFTATGLHPLCGDCGRVESPFMVAALNLVLAGHLYAVFADYSRIGDERQPLADLKRAAMSLREAEITDMQIQAEEGWPDILGE